MVIHKYGEPGAPVILLLHPMLVSGERIAAHLGSKLPEGFFLIAPDQGGHGADQGEFISPGQEAVKLHRWLIGQGIEEIRLMCAASLGGVTAMELMKLGGLRFRAVHMDGVPLAKLGGIQAQLAPTAFLRLRKQALKDPASIRKTLTDMYGGALSGSMTEQLCALSPDSVRRILQACAAGCAVPLEDAQIGSLTFEWGEKEISLQKGKPLAEKLYPQARIIVRPGMDHCEYLGREPEAYAKKLMQELEESD
ncbi:MAG: alpha/beta hydrolase [Oscillospiraceae bacterium]|nr:alpha/beta hydrolase [Oscillospiraceae bacterium]